MGADDYEPTGTDRVERPHAPDRSGDLLPDPDSLGPTYETQLAAGERRTSGSFFTPRPIAEGLVGFALVHGPRPAAICDPAVGAGAFLLAAARWLERNGLGRAEIVREHLWGADRDSHAVELTRSALWQWSDETGEATDPGSHLVVADTLVEDALRRTAPERGFDLVIGNPPFLSQLDRRTTRSRQEAAALRDRFGDALGAYTDTAALFLLAALELTAPEGRVALILPESFLAARDTAGVRDRARTLARVEGLWSAGEPVFEAKVDVCAPVLVRNGGAPAMVRRAIGPTFEPAPPVRDRWVPGRPDRWSALAVGELGEPAPELDNSRTLGELVRTTAGFRDQYYALSGSVYEADPGDDDDRGRPKLITSGLVDPAVCLWGRRSTRFLRQAWQRPRVDLARLRAANSKVARWADDLLAPKVVVATQTRVVEAAVDVGGAWYPSTPTIAVVGPPDRLWSIAAVLLAPATSAWALRRVAGTALARDAIKLSASDVADIPLPVDDDAWQQGAAILEASAARSIVSGDRPDLSEFAGAMGRAYGTPGSVQQWWEARLPTRPVPARFR